MKRQRSTGTGVGTGTVTGTAARLQNTKASATKKKAAKSRGKEEVVLVGVGGGGTTAEVIMVGGGGGGGGGNQMKIDAEIVAAVGGEWDDEWPNSSGSCSWVAVDEQMSWGTCWSPSWGMEFIGGEAYHALYDDVVWEDDIWDLKDIKNVPNSSQSLSP